MQLADPQVTGLAPYMDLLRGAIRADGPYDFVKIAHHGSHNALDAAVLAELAGTRSLAISGGVRDKGHPDPEVLLLLSDAAPAAATAERGDDCESEIVLVEPKNANIRHRGAGAKAVVIANGKIVGMQG